MKTLLFCAALLCSGAVLADELADADALLAKKAYPEALQKYTKLANAGNVTAQQHLGEMYLHGEAGAIDDVKARQWLGKAAAKGNAPAKAALERMDAREKRRADIDQWLKRYDASEFMSGEYRCPSPRFPAVSKQNDDIDRVSKNMDAWQACHNRAVEHFNASTPLTKQIPADVAALIDPDEMEGGTARLKEVQENVAESLRVRGKLVLADFTAWRDATEVWVREHNDIVNSGPSEERQRDIDARKTNYSGSK